MLDVIGGFIYGMMAGVWLSVAVVMLAKYNKRKEKEAEEKEDGYFAS